MGPADMALVCSTQWLHTCTVCWYSSTSCVECSAYCLVMFEVHWQNVSLPASVIACLLIMWLTQLRPRQLFVGASRRAIYK
jgi:hypothetical protein